MAEFSGIFNFLEYCYVTLQDPKPAFWEERRCNGCLDDDIQDTKMAYFTETKQKAEDELNKRTYNISYGGE